MFLYFFPSSPPLFIFFPLSPHDSPCWFWTANVEFPCPSTLPLPAARILSLNGHTPQGTKGRSSPGFLTWLPEQLARAPSALTMVLEALFAHCASLLWASLPTTHPWDSPRGLHHNTLQDRLRLLASGSARFLTSSHSEPPLQQPQFCRNTGYSPIQAPLLRCTSALTTSLTLLAINPPAFPCIPTTHLGYSASHPGPALSPLCKISC